MTQPPITKEKWGIDSDGWSWDTTKNSGLKTSRGLHHHTIEDMSMIFFQFLIIALKQKNFLIISIQEHQVYHGD